MSPFHAIPVDFWPFPDVFLPFVCPEPLAMSAHTTMPSRPKAWHWRCHSAEVGRRRRLASQEAQTIGGDEIPKTHAPTVFFHELRLAWPLRPHSLFSFFTPQHHGIAADRQFLPTLPGCLPISPARLLIPLSFCICSFVSPRATLIRSETAFVASLYCPPPNRCPTTTTRGEIWHCPLLPSCHRRTFRIL